MKTTIPILISLAIIFLGACSPSPEAVAIQKSELATSAFVATESAPKPGQWTGVNHAGTYPVPVSFSIGTDGKIHGFRFVYSLGDDSCTIEAGEIVVKADRTFSFTFGESGFEDANTIRGRFETPTSVVGTTSHTIECVGYSGNYISSFSGGGPTNNWYAELAVDQYGMAVSTSTVTPSPVPKINVLVLAVDPFDNAILYAGVENGGVYISTDSGGRWKKAGSEFANSSVYALAVDPTIPGTVYAGTWFQGVYKSTDHGLTWAPTGTTDTRIADLVIEPVNPTTIYAATSGSGVIKSTDSGESWNEANFGLGDDSVSSLVIDPTNPGVLYAGISEHGVYRTDSGGAKWNLVSNDLNEISIMDLVIDPRDSSHLYIATLGDGVLVSNNAGVAWSEINHGLTDYSVLTLLVDPVLFSTEYVGTFFSGVYQWSPSDGKWLKGNTDLAYTHALAIVPGSPSALYAGTWNGVYVSFDQGENWTALNTGLVR